MSDTNYKQIFRSNVNTLIGAAISGNLANGRSLDWALKDAMESSDKIIAAVEHFADEVCGKERDSDVDMHQV